MVLFGGDSAFEVQNVPEKTVTVLIKGSDQMLMADDQSTC